MLSKYRETKAKEEGKEGIRVESELGDKQRFVEGTRVIGKSWNRELEAKKKP